VKCDIIIPIWNQLESTRRSIESIRQHTSYPYTLILIDNGSDNETRDYLSRISNGNDNVRLIRNEENLGFVKAVNQGLKSSQAGYLCLMNNDTIATEGWLTKMASLADSDARIGLVNPRSEDPGRLSLDEYSSLLAKNGLKYLETNQCMGFCVLIKREVIDKVGYLDEAYGMGGFDDTDLSRRADHAGYKCVCSRSAYVFHKWHTSFGKGSQREALVKKNEKIYMKKWGKDLRIAYPINYRERDAFGVDVNTCLGLAREWNWVHVWISGRRSPLPEHQSLRFFSFSRIDAIFYLEVLFRLIERRLKGRKLFDLILVSDRRLLKALSLFKNLFSFPIYYIDRTSFRYGNSDDSWRKRAQDIVSLVKRKAY